LFVLCFLYTYSIQKASLNSSFLIINLIFLWIICFLAETHRAPFDFREAESELVRGFNTEYTGAIFAFLFLREYIIILFGCILIALLFLTGPLEIYNTFVINSVGLIIAFSTIWIRITFCRYRYDVLISIAWKTLLPLTLSIFLLTFILNW
jgi:NADH:ubiquinone oxidoreductase subunit H